MLELTNAHYIHDGKESKALTALPLAGASRKSHQHAPGGKSSHSQAQPVAPDRFGAIRASGEWHACGEGHQQIVGVQRPEAEQGGSRRPEQARAQDGPDSDQNPREYRVGTTKRRP